MTRLSVDPGSRLDYSRYMELIGISPSQFQTLVAVMSHELCYGSGVPRRRVAAMLGVRDANASALIRRGLLSTEGEPLAHQRLRATDRAWREFWPTRQLLAAERALESA